MSEVYDVVIVGGGPAGLSAALNLGRARERVLLIDADRPRNAATLRSHGFLTRDGVPPNELRTLARDELTAYPNVQVRVREKVFSLTRDGTLFHGVVARREPTVERPGDEFSARAVIVATGLTETLPEVPNLRGFYGMSLFSCAACDAWELQDRALALIGESADLSDRARLIARWAGRLTIFTNGADVVSLSEEAELAAIDVSVERAVITELVGERGALSAIRLSDGSEHAVDGGFVRPQWSASLDFLRDVGPEVDEAGHLVVDRSGRTSVPGLYAAGDVASGPQQLIVAAGAGARVAAVIVHDAVGIVTAH